jgi:hypothetical protein
VSQPRDERQDDLFGPYLEKIINLRHPEPVFPALLREIGVPARSTVPSLVADASGWGEERIAALSLSRWHTDTALTDVLHGRLAKPTNQKSSCILIDRFK